VIRLKSRSLIGGAVACLAVLALTACDPQQAGAAAIVGGQRISENELQDSVRSLVDLKKETGQQAGDVAALTRQELTERVESLLVERAAAAEGVQVTDGEVRGYIAGARSDFGEEKQFRAALANANVAPADLDSYTRFFLLREKLAGKLGGANDPSTGEKYGQLILKTGNEVGVHINPRYGAWDPKKGVGGPPDDLSRAPTAEPAPTPGQ
jgi:hypothetical protein